jgi:hypothetical protein
MGQNIILFPVKFLRKAHFSHWHLLKATEKLKWDSQGCSFSIDKSFPILKNKMKIRTGTAFWFLEKKVYLAPWGLGTDQAGCDSL